MTSPLARVGAANAVTVFRAGLVVLLAMRIGQHAPPGNGAWMAVAVAVAVAVLDGVDGWLARRTGSASRFGARFDMETDALFILVLSMLAWRWGKAGAWVLLSGLMRYLFIAAGFVLPWMRAPLGPTMRAKTVAVVQMVALIVAIGPIVQTPLSSAVAAVALGLLCWSFAIDVGRLGRARRGGP